MFKRQTFCHVELVRFLTHEPKAKIGKKKERKKESLDQELGMVGQFCNYSAIIVLGTWCTDPVILNIIQGKLRKKLRNSATSRGM